MFAFRNTPLRSSALQLVHDERSPHIPKAVASMTDLISEAHLAAEHLRIQCIPPVLTDGLASEMGDALPGTGSTSHTGNTTFSAVLSSVGNQLRCLSVTFAGAKHVLGSSEGFSMVVFMKFTNAADAFVLSIPEDVAALSGGANSLT